MILDFFIPPQDWQSKPKAATKLDFCIEYRGVVISRAVDGFWSGNGCRAATIDVVKDLIDHKLGGRSYA
jgi:hypothetical protein